MDTIRVGYISSIDYKNGTAQVVYKDRDNSVSPFLPFFSNEWNPPKIDTMVYTIHLSNGGTRGMILVPPYTEGNRPVEGNPNIWRKDFGDGGFIRYDKTKKELEIAANNIVIDGNLHIKGNLKVDGIIKE